MSSEYTVQFPLCEATGVPVGCELEEKRLEDTLTIDDKVQLKLKIGVQPTVQEEMTCELPYDLPGEKWVVVNEYDKQYCVSNKRRLRKVDGTPIHLVHGYYRTDKLGANIFLNPSKLAVEYFNKEDLRDDPLLDKYYNKFHFNGIVAHKLETGEKLTPEEITECTLDIDLPGEEWKPVPKWEDLYQASNLGRIKSSLSNKVIHPFKNPKGYVNLKFYRDADWTTVKVHAIIMFTWKPKTAEDICLGRNQVNHLDGDRLNNQITNLVWCTNQENQIHAARELRNNTMTYEFLVEAKELCDKGYTLVKIAQELNEKHNVHLDPKCIGKALRRETLKWVSTDEVPIPDRFKKE